mgnify:CR=1 FL=1
MESKGRYDMIAAEMQAIAEAGSAQYTYLQEFTFEDGGTIKNGNRAENLTSLCRCVDKDSLWI